MMVLSSLQAGLDALYLSVSPAQRQSLLDFLTLLTQWNQAYNLTAITDMADMMTHHLLDSLSISRFLQGNTVLDVGSGGGFPGVPLAICHLEQSFTLLDSVGKKVRFLRHVKHRLQLDNVSCEQARMQEFEPAARFDIIVCRAVGSMPQIISATQHLLKPSGKWLFMKGLLSEIEREALPVPAVIHRLVVPGLAAERHVVELYKEGLSG